MSFERPIIGFLTDFGLDGAAATCRAVMLSICRDAQIIDIAHTIRKYAIADGAYLLRFYLPYAPIGVHVAVVDPGVGTARRPIAIKTGRGDVLVGPDNGLLVTPAEALGGPIEARELANRNLWLPATTSTFHGRDIFAPVAAHLAAADAEFEDVGPVVPLDRLVRVPEPNAVVNDAVIETSVTYVDSFGNIRLAGGRDDLVRAFGDDLADGLPLSAEFHRAAGATREETRYATTFGAVARGDSLVYVDSLGNVAMADNQGNLAARLGIEPEIAVRIERR